MKWWISGLLQKIIKHYSKKKSMTKIIDKLKKSGLLGRSGSGFPAGLKWEMVKKQKAEKKYIVCNAASGEPMVLKDEYILKNHPEEVIEGIKIALKTIDHSSAFVYMRKDFYSRFKKRLEKMSKGLKITFFKKPGGYLAGEETSLCEAIEGKKPEPRIKPPFPTESGIFGYPTLINNVETFYFISKIAKNEYQGTRFYTLAGDIKNKGVYEMPVDWTIEKILKETDNWPKFDFFLQSGGGASGEILLKKELNEKQVKGPGAIIVFNRDKTDLLKLMKNWTEFFMKENCDKCVPCREGVYQINEMLKKGKLNKKKIKDLAFVLETTSFCGLGKVAGIPFSGLINKVIK